MAGWLAKSLRISTAIVITGILGGAYGHLTNEVKIKTLNYQLVKEEFSWEEDPKLAKESWANFQKSIEDQAISNVCKKLISLNTKVNAETCKDWVEDQMEKAFYFP